MMSKQFIVGLLMTLTLCSVHGLVFELEPRSSKCIRDETGHNVLVTGEYEVQHANPDDPQQQVDYLIKDPRNNLLGNKESLTKGKFSFVTDGGYEICFYSKAPNRNGPNHQIVLNTKQGVDAKTYDGLSEVAHLKPMELDLRKLEDLSDAIVQDFLVMKKSEEDMRNTNESTNNRVLFFSIFSMCCLLGLATWQTLYLRRFFKAKKLID